MILGRYTLFAGIILVSLPFGCSIPEKGKARGPEKETDLQGYRGPGNQGITGRFEALGGAHPPEPGCENLTSPTVRDSCERAYLREMMWPLRGSAIIRNAKGDSLILELDSLGGYRALLPPGLYTVCVQADGVDLEDRCRDSVEVKPGAFTPNSRPFPMP